MSRAGIVLCGGRSSRMGRAKAWLPWFGRTMVEHVVGILANVVDEVVVVTSESLALPPLTRFGARIVRDRQPALGPLAGIRDGLSALDSDADFAFVTSTDAPFLTEAFVASLLDRERACAPLSQGFVQVLSAVYPRTGWETADRLLAEGAGRPLHLLESVGYERIECAHDLLDSQGGAGSRFPWHGFNTPQAYLEAVREVDPAATAEIESTGRVFQALEARDVQAAHEARAGHGDAPRRVPVGTLEEVLSHWPDTLGLVRDGRLADGFRVSLGDHEIVQDLGVPVGPGERVRILHEASA